MEFERLGLANTLSRRSAIRALLGGTSLALLAACGPQAPTPLPTSPPAAARANPPANGSATSGNPTPAAAAPTTNPTQAGAPTQAPQPKRGGTLRAGLVGDVGVINPH